MMGGGLDLKNSYFRPIEARYRYQKKEDVENEQQRRFQNAVVQGRLFPIEFPIEDPTSKYELFPFFRWGKSFGPSQNLSGNREERTTKFAVPLSTVYRLPNTIQPNTANNNRNLFLPS